MKNVYRSIICVLAIVLTFSILTINTKAKTVTNMKNVVVFVDFKDTNHDHIQSAYGECFLENPNIDALWNGSLTAYPKSLKSYISKISYGTINVDSVFPQLKNGKITTIKLDQNASYYNKQMDTLVYDVLTKLNSTGLLSNSQVVDGDGNGDVDNFTIVLPTESANYNEMFNGLHAVFSGSTKLNGKYVRHYNIITESGAYLSNGQSGLIIHEFLHTLGYPDLYRSTGSTVTNPVGQWDIMASESMYVQYPLAYTRSVIGQYFSIPEVTTDQKSYTLYNVDYAINNESVKDNQAVIIKTAASNSEFFVVEYRKQSPQYVGNQYNENGYDRMIYGSGLVIYRVNTALSTKSNYPTNQPFYIYVFRPNETTSKLSYGDGLGDLRSSYFSSESGRTVFGSNDANATIKEGALTYSDGTNSGILISNIGSASGNSITFDITIDLEVSKDYWQTVATSSQTGVMVSGTNNGADLYFALYNFDGSGSILKVSGNSISKLASLNQGTDYKIAFAKKAIYVAYIDKSYQLRLGKIDNGSLTNIYSTYCDVDAGYYDLYADSTGVYLAYILNQSGNTKKVIVEKYDGSSIYVGDFTTSSNATNPFISKDGTNICVGVREWMNSNKTRIYLNTGEDFVEVNNNYSSDYPITAINSGHIYTVANDNGSSAIYDYKISSKSWSKLGGKFSNSISEGKLFFVGSSPYIAYCYSNSTASNFSIYYYGNSAWNVLGNAIDTANAVNSAMAFVNGNDIYTAYLNSEGNLCIKKHSASSNATVVVQEKNKTVNYTVKYVCGSETLESKKYSEKVVQSENRIEIKSGSVDIKNFEGYSFESVSMNVSANDFVESGTVITFTYSKNQTDQPNTPDNPNDEPDQPITPTDPVVDPEQPDDPTEPIVEPDNPSDDPGKQEPIVDPIDNPSGEPSNIVTYILIGVGCILIIGIILILGRKKKDEEN